MSIRIIQFLSVLLVLVSNPVLAKVLYEISIDQPQHHFAQVSMVIPKGKTEVTIQLPTWRTGKYKILDFASGVRNFKAINEDGVLKWERLDKSAWKIHNPSAERVEVGYSLYANELGSRTRHIDSTHAFLDLTSVLMYEPSLMNTIHQVKLKVPEKWKSYSGMTQLGDHEFIAQSYHQLASSPIETGISELKEFSSGDREYQLVIWGRGNFDSEEMASDLKALVGQGSSIWSEYPYKKYVFIVHATSGASGATEHINSTVIQRPRFSFAPRENYLKFLRTASHEFVHTWNVKAYRPENLVPYDYQQENYSDLLWVAEGSTSYLQERLLLTAELQTLTEFLKGLSRRIHQFQRRPGHQQQSVADASYEQWISQGGDFANNHSVSIYSEGYIASLLFDAQLLSDSKLAAGYKDLHGLIYDKLDKQSESFQRLFAGSYSEKTLKAFATELTGKSYETWWANNIDQPMVIDFSDLLAKAGLKFSDQEEEDFKVWTGFDSKESNGFLTLTRVEKDGPAWEAKLTPGDQIVAINRLKVSPKHFKNQLKSFQVGDSLELTVFRSDQLLTTKLALGKISKKPRAIETVTSASQQQKAFFKAWLGIEFPESEDK